MNLAPGLQLVLCDLKPWLSLSGPLFLYMSGSGIFMFKGDPSALPGLFRLCGGAEPQQGTHNLSLAPRGRVGRDPKELSGGCRASAGGEGVQAVALPDVLAVPRSPPLQPTLPGRLLHPGPSCGQSS